MSSVTIAGVKLEIIDPISGMKYILTMNERDVERAKNDDVYVASLLEHCRKLQKVQTSQNEKKQKIDEKSSSIVKNNTETSDPMDDQVIHDRYDEDATDQTYDKADDFSACTTTKTNVPIDHQIIDGRHNGDTTNQTHDNADDFTASIDKENEHQDSGTYNWSDKATLDFILTYKENEAMFSSGKFSQKDCWLKVKQNLVDKGYNVSSKKCSTKFLSLKRRYKDIKDHNSKSGNNRMTWQYYDAMDEIFFKKPWIAPLATASSTRKMPAATSPTSEHVAHPKSSSDSSRKKADVHSYLKELTDCKKELRMDKKKYNDAKIARLDTMNKLLAKLVDKEDREHQN